MSLPSLRNICLVLLIVLITSFPASGWDCQRKTPDEWFSSSDIVFEGKVVYKRSIFYGEGHAIDSTDVTFKVLNVDKGDLADLVKVRTGVFDDSPGYPFLCEETYKVYAIKDDEGIYRTSVCQPVKPLNENAPTYEELELTYSLIARIFQNSVKMKFSLTGTSGALHILSSSSQEMQARYLSSGAASGYRG